MPISEALAIARQIAEALDEAHEKGIVHRDLKPANIVLQGSSGLTSSDVRAKVLDFGLAKTIAGEHGDLARVATITSEGTQEGRILGTPAYMSPEQARGLTVDKRTDIWAFGCVLFEMLTGRRPFEGNTVTDTVARILERDPDWTVLPAETPTRVRTLLERCLRKDPRKRLHDVADARIELEDGSPGASEGAAPAVSHVAPRRKRERLAWILAAVLGIALLGMALRYFPAVRTEPTDVVEFQISPVEDSRYSGNAPEFAMSPDGRHVAFAASFRGVSMVWVRSLATSELRMLPGTEGALGLFWKPDSQAIGFFAGRQLKTVQLSGGSPVVLCPLPQIGPASASGTWNADGVIVFEVGNRPLERVSAVNAGEQPTPVTALTKTDVAHRWPEFLPDGQHFLYLAQGGAADELRIGSLTSTATVSLGPFESHGAYAAGHLLFVRGGNLTAQPFDAEALQLRGEPIVLTAQTGVNPPWQRGMFSMSATGRLAYSRMARIPSELTWLDRHGRPLGIVGNAGVFFNLDLSPDERFVAVSQLTQPGATAQFDIWVIDLTRANTSFRLTDDPAWDFDPAWSPDGRLAFNSNRPDPWKSPWRLFVRASDGSGEDEPLVTDGSSTVPDWSRDGRFIVYSKGGSTTLRDLWTVNLTGDRRAVVFLSTQHEESQAAFSPDGRWIAYRSNASGRSEVYVRPFPVQPGLFPISRDGGFSPRWRADGQELFFLSLDGAMMAVDIDTRKGFRAGVPRKFFATHLRPGNNRPYAVTRDGQRFLIPQIGRGAPITVVLNWPAMLASKRE